ncbi:MAG: DNA polymerase III subunit delta [Gammaproteobacteria bacterium]
MKISPEALAGALHTGLAPVYLIAGDEPLQREEAADQVRRSARERGYTEREVFFVERGFDWRQLESAAASLSLFGTQRVLDVRLPSGKPSEGAAVLMAYAANPPPDTVLLVVSARLERGGGAWAQALERAGALLQVWPIEADKLPAWLAKRMRSRGLEPDAQAVALLAERVEGNLLAATQEIDKLRLLHGPGPIDAEALRATVVDSARYDPYKLVDAALGGDAARAAHILDGLREEGVEPNFVLWTLTQETRKLGVLAWDIRAGTPRARALAGVWEKRRGLADQALARHAPDEWRKLLALLAHADLVAKGRAAGRLWDELLNFCVRLAGLRLPA